MRRFELGATFFNLPLPSGQLALAEGTYTAEYVEFEVRRALEWIGGNEHKRLAAVSHMTCHMTCLHYQLAPHLSAVGVNPSRAGSTHTYPLLSANTTVF